MRWLRSWAGAAAFVASAPVVVQAQTDDWRTDPYTDLRPAAMEALGYVSYGPFSWGDGHGTAAIEALLGRRLLWVETDHFKIGCSLGVRPIPGDSTGREVLYDDLEELHRSLRTIPSKVAELDPWLSMHLYALRLERLHRDFRARSAATGQTDLGRRGKFLLLLLETEADLARYTASYCGVAHYEPTRHLFEETDSLLFATAVEGREGRLYADDVLHPHVVFHVSQNLLEGYCDYERKPPLWFSEGLGHWYARRVDPRTNDFSGFDPEQRHRIKEAEWEPVVWGRVRHETDPPLGEVLGWSVAEQMDLTAHAVAWSRTEFLMGLGPEGFARFVHFCRERPLRSRFMPLRLVREWHERALAHAYGLELDEFERRWRRHVLVTYERR